MCMCVFVYFCKAKIFEVKYQWQLIFLKTLIRGSVWSQCLPYLSFIKSTYLYLDSITPSGVELHERQALSGSTTHRFCPTALVQRAAGSRNLFHPEPGENRCCSFLRKVLFLLSTSNLLDENSLQRWFQWTPGYSPGDLGPLSQSRFLLLSEVMT